MNPIPRHSRGPRAIAIALVGVAALLLAPSLTLAAPAGAATALGASSDSANRATWTLSNGMRVLLQHVPDGNSIAISIGYPGGYDQDPPGQDGLALLLAELQFTAAAGDVPARSRRELTSQRPAGFDVHVGRSLTILTEVATRAQFPGVLQQAGRRLSGVEPDQATLTAALETARTRLHDQFQGPPDVALFNEVERRASGFDAAAIQRLATLAGIEKLTPAALRPLLRKAFPSQHAVIAVAGNLTGLELRAMLEHALAGVPGGTPPALPPVRPAHSLSAVARRAGLVHPVGVLGIIAPALSDSIHPAFFMASLIMGGETGSQWGEPSPPLRSFFQFSVLEDPDLVRYYPPLEDRDRQGEAVGERFNSTLGGMDNVIVSDVLLESVRSGVAWILGGPIYDEAMDRIRASSSALILCSTNMAERELRGGEEFWSVYRRRLEQAGMPDLVYWLGYMRDAKQQVRLLYVPG